ncbi:hypothetical protein P7K49_004794 [Saguinus oedipus]|uniref:Uncharacterized protein n=1 Tax=Saguinus oedipus TaxID=9490 RepID=A0ABQ9WC15_SAGOE|nr:hypothetical protein P7K49_004794 [Saguinus oedipus]
MRKMACPLTAFGKDTILYYSSRITWSDRRGWKVTKDLAVSTTAKLGIYSEVFGGYLNDDPFASSSRPQKTGPNSGLLKIFGD